MRQIGRIAMTGFLTLQVLLGSVLMPAVTHAQLDVTTPPPANIPSYIGRGVEQSLSDYLCTPSEANAGTALYSCVSKLYRFAIAFGAIALVFFVVLSGYMYLSGGETAKQRGKTMFTSALTGVVLILSSYVLLSFINPQLTQIRTIQPPIFDAADLPRCEKIGFVAGCLLANGQVYTGNGGVAGSASEAKYKDLIAKYAQQRGIEYCALSALMQKESTYNYLAVSNPPPSSVNTSASPPTYGINFESVGHGIGLIQIYIYERKRGPANGWVNGVPARAGAGFGFNRPLYVKDLIDPEINVQAGSFLWAKNLKDNNNNIYEAYRDYQGPQSKPATLQALVDMYTACKRRS